MEPFFFLAGRRQSFSCLQCHWYRMPCRICPPPPPPPPPPRPKKMATSIQSPITNRTSLKVLSSSDPIHERTKESKKERKGGTKKENFGSRRKMIGKGTSLVAPSLHSPGRTLATFPTSRPRYCSLRSGAMI